MQLPTPALPKSMLPWPKTEVTGGTCLTDAVELHPAGIELPSLPLPKRPMLKLVNPCIAGDALLFELVLIVRVSLSTSTSTGGDLKLVFWEGDA